MLNHYKANDIRYDDASSPVLRIPTDRPDARPEDGIALCLSGGGYRAMLFHVGALWRLNNAAYLPKLKRVSSVSGGSITAGVLGLAWRRLDFNSSGVAQSFQRDIVHPVRHLASKTIDVGAVLLGLFGPGTASDRIASAYRKHHFGASTLQDLPDDAEGPRFVINASNIQSGALWRFSKPYAQDWRVGRIERPKIGLAVAVAASSAFPPFLSPAILRFKEGEVAPAPGTNLNCPPYTTHVYLTDGGVYDNLGLETAWKNYSTVLVSDGGGRMAPNETPSCDWPRHTLRVLTLLDNQVRSRRKIQVVGSYEVDPSHPGHRKGAYWSSWTDIDEYELQETLSCPHEKTLKLANLPTRLSRVDPVIQKQLINWGFAVCDAAMRRYGDPTIPPAGAFPYPDVGVG